MLRYAKLYFYFVRFSFSRAMEFRIDFFFRIFMDIIFYAVNILFYKLIFLHTPFLVGWREDQVMVFVAGYLILDAVYMTVFANNMWWLPIYINRGDLDYYLTRPASSMFILSLREFAANSFLNLILAFAIFIWALGQCNQSFSSFSIMVFLVMILNGVLLHYLLNMAMLIPIFWTHSGRGFQQVLWTFQRFMERPDRLFSGWVRKILVTVLPFSLMASFPARLILDGMNPWIVVHIFAVTLLFWVFVQGLWKWGLRAYSSASS